MKNSNVTILAVGDSLDYDSFKKFHKDRRYFANKGFNYIGMHYEHLLKGTVPDIETQKVIVFHYFPFNYWNRFIEHRGYKGLYGNLGFARKFSVLSNRVYKILKSSLRDKEICFVNDPKRCAFYRDKLKTKRRLTKGGIKVPKTYNVKNPSILFKGMERGRTYLIKPRCGSMGKGITYLGWENWQTNFIVKKNRIINRISDKGWHFSAITDNKSFLRKLLMKDVITEEAINMIVIDKQKVDLRIYTFFNKVLYIYPRKNRFEAVTTNITQGGRGDPSLLKRLPGHLVKKAVKIAEKASRVLGFNLAGVDVIMDNNLKDVYIVDINAFPGFPRRRTHNLSRQMIDELADLLKRRRICFEKGKRL